VSAVRTTGTLGTNDLSVLDGAEGDNGSAPRVPAHVAAKTKLRKCRQCAVWFVPQYNRIQPTCSPACAILYARRNAAKVARREHLELKRKSIPLSKLKSQAQHEWNRYIRARDLGQPCISCGRNSGAKMNAGHYRTTKAAPHLRYDEDNTNLQCEACNSYLSGNIVEYRKGLIRKIGVDRVEALENNNEVVRWTREDLIAMRKDFLGRWKTLEAVRK
jgi:hypothetical protein